MDFKRLVGCFVLAGLAACAQAAVPAGKAAAELAAKLASPPAEKRAPEKVWLSQVVLDELTRAAAGGDYAALAGRMDAAILARLACGRVNDLTALNDMVYVRRACQYLGALGKGAEDAKFARWLLEHRPVTRLLLRALGDVKRPEAALKDLRELVTAEEKAVLAYPELAVAFATSQPMRFYRKLEKQATLLESFRWYACTNVPFRYNLRNMPYELSRHLADSRLPIEERKWAVVNYTRTPNLATTYFHVKYDTEHYLTGGARKIDPLPYTLPNLRQVGGVCIDQAYYASHVCKALGVPATIVSGRGGGGMHHAWVACLMVSPDGKSAYWETRIGRYESHLYFLGLLRSPVDGRNIPDSELALSGAAAQLPLNRREEADAAVTLARIADKARDAAAKPDPQPLLELAKLYDQRFAEAPGALKADAADVAETDKIDLACVVELLAAAIERNLAEKDAWELVIELRQGDRMPVDNLDRFFDVLVTRTAKVYPDYSCEMILRIAPGISDPARREKVYKRTAEVYQRPDLQGRILLALGDDYRTQGRKDDALNTYGQAAERTTYIADVVIPAARRAEDLLREAGKKDIAINMYRQLFARTKPTPTAQAFRQQTSNYQLGKRLAELLAETGQDQAAATVRRQIGETR